MEERLKFVADEGVEKEIVLELRKTYDVIYIAETAQGSEDSYILNLAEKEARILLTLDKDFGELVFRLGQIHAGVVLCRLHGMALSEKCSLVRTTIEKYQEELSNAFTIIQPNNIRIRKRTV